VAHLDLVQESSGNVCVHVNSLLLLHQLWEGGREGGREELKRRIYSEGEMTM